MGTATCLVRVDVRAIRRSMLRLPSAFFPEHRPVLSRHAWYACAHGSAQLRSEPTVSALYAFLLFVIKSTLHLNERNRLITTVK